jgi:hypothetical protein
MKYYTRKGVQVGDIHAFKQMLEDVINHKKVNQKDNYKRHISFSHNDKHYQYNTKVKIDATDKGC